MKIGIKTRICAGVGLLTLLGIICILVESVEIKKNAPDSYGSMMTLSVICIVLMLVLCALVVWSCLSAINKHLLNLSLYSDKIAKGEVGFTVKAPVEDEFSNVYDSLNNIVKVNKEDSSIAEAIASGDLTVSVEPKSKEDILGMSMAHLVKNNNEVLVGIKESSFRLTTGAEQVAAASQALAQGSTEQAAAIDEITTSMNNIKDMTKSNAEKANAANGIVQETKKNAVLGNDRMHQMKAAMDEINEASDKINKIIKVIDDISFQTNILALNAAVEAARAGTHGKGFAVVAEQIRELAAKSASAAAETAEMIDDSIRKVQNGTKLAEETASALETIVTDVDKVVDITGGIADASNEQAGAVMQADQAIIQVSMVVQNNSATSEECAAAAEELSGQSLALRNMISRYKLQDASAAPVSRRAKDKDVKPRGQAYSEVNPESVISLDGDFGKY